MVNLYSEGFIVSYGQEMAGPCQDTSPTSWEDSRLRSILILMIPADSPELFSRHMVIKSMWLSFRRSSVLGYTVQLSDALGSIEWSGISVSNPWRKGELLATRQDLMKSSKTGKADELIGLPMLHRTAHYDSANAIMCPGNQIRGWSECLALPYFYAG